MKHDRALTDLHCHILPGVDDGAPSLAVSAALLQMQRAQGVTRVAFTPHFSGVPGERDAMLAARDAAAARLHPVLAQNGMAYLLGAEVRMTPQLLEQDPAPLCLGDTPYLLLEWPALTYPLWGPALVRQLQQQGVRPIFAHIERYAYFFAQTENLTPFLQQGALCQMNADAVLCRHTRKRALALIRRGYVQLLASDAHDPVRRPPRLRQAFALVEQRLGKACAAQLARQAEAVFCGRG